MVTYLEESAVSNRKRPEAPRIWTTYEVEQRYKAYCRLIDEGFLDEGVLFRFSGLVRIPDRPPAGSGKAPG